METIQRPKVRMREAASDNVDQVRAFYDRQPEREWHRLVRHRVEYAVTLRALRDTLSANARVLDVGGGPGRYAVALASAGHAVTLFDLSPRLLARARDHAAKRKVRLDAFVEGSATDLGKFDTASFDAVLLLGPLYHLQLAEARGQALREARRVLVPGGALLAAFVTRYAPLRYLARIDPRSLVQDAERYEALLANGFLPGAKDDDFVAYGYFARAEEIPPLLESAGFDSPRLLAAEGIVDGIDEKLIGLQGPAWNAWADLNYDLASDPGLLASTSHILAITRRPVDV
jgi:ubiquinone/menaquinone biosynthesis C-methylase UbiE